MQQIDLEKGMSNPWISKQQRNYGICNISFYQGVSVKIWFPKITSLLFSQLNNFDKGSNRWWIPCLVFLKMILNEWHDDRGNISWKQSSTEKSDNCKIKRIQPMKWVKQASYGSLETTTGSECWLSNWWGLTIETGRTILQWPVQIILNLEIVCCNYKSRLNWASLLSMSFEFHSATTDSNFHFRKNKRTA